MTITHNHERVRKLKTGAAAREVGVSPQTLRRYANRGLISPIILPSGRMLWPVAEVRRFRAELEHQRPLMTAAAVAS